MNRLIIFATGNVYKFAAKRCTGKVTQNARLDVIRERQPRIDRVELTFTGPETALEFKPSPNCSSTPSKEPKIS